MKVLHGDCIELMKGMGDLSVDLVFGSPPYADARLYLENGQDLGISRGCVEWVEWMLDVTTEAHRICKGPVIWVAAGVTCNRNYWPCCEGLMWEWWKRGGECQLYRPCIFNRVGIPGSGGDDWLRNDWEFCMAFKRSGKLPWSDNTALGHPPKWARWGEMSHRLSDGQRKQFAAHKRQHTKTRANGEMETQHYAPPVKANPGNVIRCQVGGGRMGSPIAHENEAPFPEKLAEFFVRSCCPPGGITLDPFSGSGTTGAVCKRFHREFIGMDLRASQVELTKKRLSEAQPELFA